MLLPRLQSSAAILGEITLITGTRLRIKSTFALGIKSDIINSGGCYMTNNIVVTL